MQDKLKILREQLEYLKRMSKVLKELGLGATRTESIRVALINCTPISGAFTAALANSQHELEVLRVGTDEEKVDLYLRRQLTGKSWTSEVFSIRTSHSRILNQARMVKDTINSLKVIPDTIESITIPTSDKEIQRVEKMTARLNVARDRIKNNEARPGENTHSSWVLPESKIKSYLKTSSGTRA
jgi:hypothetical protein